MPLAKKMMKSKKQNQGAQWGDTGSPGDIKTVKNQGAPERAGSPVNSKRGRNKSIGR
jgi:hypothetical protein